MSTPQNAMIANTSFSEPAKESVPSMSPFEQLPPEIRIMIFKNLLTSASPFDLSKYEWDLVNANWQRFRTLARQASKIIRINKTTSVEAAEVLYGSNEFHFSNHHGWRILDAFLQTIGDANARFARNIAVHAPFLPFGVLTSPLSPSNLAWTRRNWGLAAPAYNPFPAPDWTGGAFDAYGRSLKAATVRNVCRRLARLRGLRKLRLLFSVDCFAADGAFDFLTDTLVCAHDCEDADLRHVQHWHQDRFAWDELDALRGSVGVDLDVGFVLVHPVIRGGSDAFEQVFSDRLMAEMYVWLLYRAKAKGYRVGYGYDMVGIDDDVDLDLRNDRNENVLEPISPRWRFPDGASRYARPRGEPPHDEFRSELRAGFIFGDDDVEMTVHGPLAFRRRIEE